MAKRKRRKRTTKKEKLEIKKEVYAILFVLIAIIGLGKLGPVGRFIASFSLFLTGSIYMVFLALLLILGIYIFIKGEWPEFFSTKFLGFYMFVIGLLSFMHWDFVILNNGNTSIVFRETVNELTKAFNLLMKTGSAGEGISVGGGIIGWIFASIFSFLFSSTGMKIISIVFLVCGILLFTGFSISDFIRNTMTEVKDKTDTIKKTKNKDNDNDEEEDDDDEKKKVIISNGNEIEEVEKPTIKSIDDLKKTPVVGTKEEEEEKNRPVMNPSYQLPPLDILDKPKNKNKGMDNAAIEANIVKLEEVLKSFGVTAKVVEVHIGPTVAQYELEIATGTRVNKITTLSREIALALSKKDVRIEAPIPGKSTVGVEFANDTPSSVSFYEIMASKTML